MLGRLIHCLFLMLVIPVGKSSVNAQCRLESSGSVDSNFKDGDLIIGALMQFSIGTSLLVNDFTSNKWLPACTFSSLYYLRHLLAFMFAIEEINSRSDILPNVTLGYMLYDTCVIEYTAIESTLKILSGLNTSVPNYGCHKDSALVAIIGHMLSASSIHISKLSGLYGYPQISYGAMDSIFNDKSQFPYFYRTVPDESIQYEAIVQLLEHFGWSWVGIVTSEDESSQRASNEIQSSMIQRDICIEFLVSISDDGSQEKNKEAITIIKKSRCSVIILLCNSSALMKMLAVIDNLRKVGIALSSFHIITDLENLRHINGSLLFRVQKREIPGLKDFLLQASPLKYPDNLLLRDIWDLYLCSPGNFSNMFNCDYKEVLSSVDPSVFDVTNFRFTFSVYAAVYAVAYALHDMFLHRNLSFTESTSLKRNLQPWELNRYLQKVHFNTPGGEEVFFDELGNSPGKFDIINIVWTANNALKRIPVGHIHQSGSDYQISINESAIEWDPYFSQTPRSVCTESCIPGYRKAHQEGRPKCCYNCIPCPEGEITNNTDMKSCSQCPEDQWSNSRRDECVPRSIEYLSYDEPLGLALAVSAVSLSAVTVAVLGIFIIHRDTPVVKANNQNLSYTLLVFLSLSFLCPFLFIGHPTKISCLLRQVTFGIIFTVSVSSILAKTVIVVMAFNATNPNWNLKRYFGKSMASTLVLVCSLGQVLICVAWLIYSPPFPELNTQVEVGKIILQCNEGSVTLFYTDIGYMGFLAFFSFVVAFLARNLPDTFNEAQYITFSMLVFCSVWISFIPAYLSTKGKYMVAVEIFTILASGVGLLGCIFIPKCYIIILRPEMNVRINIKNERKGKQINM